MSARAEQLVLEYLSRVADEARGILRSDERLRFVSRVRASIDQERHRAGGSGLNETRRMLARFGDPKVLVERERHRLDEAGRPPVRGPAAGKAGMPRAQVPSAADASSTVHAAAADHGRPWRPPSDRPRVSAAGGRSSPGSSHPAFDLLSTTRRFRLAALAVILLGPGGVLLPFPLWLTGAAIAVTSWAWNRPEKLVGLVCPLIAVMAGVGVIGALNKNPSIPVDLHAYIAAAHTHGRLLMGVGAMAGALFLGARLLRRYRAVVRRSADG